MKGALLAAGLAGAAMLAACGTSDDTSSTESAASGCFLAFNTQYSDFRTWTSYSFDGPGEGDAGVHVAGPRIEYIKAAPPHGSATFPVGTLIVKEVGIGDPANHHIFAMAKRGCDFNASGAKGWEWMEIQEISGGASIIWRGVGPPAGEVYGGDPTGCNSCHVACSDNDSVCSSHVRLTAF